MNISLTVSSLPRTHRGIAWAEVFAAAKPGQKYHLACTDAGSAVMIRQCTLKAAKNIGIPFSSTIAGNTVTVSIMDRQDRDRRVYSNHTDIAAAEARSNNLNARIREADAKVACCQRQIALCALPEDKAKARGVFAAWRMTAARLRAEQNARSLATA